MLCGLREYIHRSAILTSDMAFANMDEEVLATYPFFLKPLVMDVVKVGDGETGHGPETPVCRSLWQRPQRPPIGADGPSHPSEMLSCWPRFPPCRWAGAWAAPSPTPS